MIPENLNKELVNEVELRTLLRRQGFENLAEIKAAILEISGSITVERAADLPTSVEAKLLIRLERIEQLIRAV